MFWQEVGKGDTATLLTWNHVSISATHPALTNFSSCLFLISDTPTVYVSATTTAIITTATATTLAAATPTTTTTTTTTTTIFTPTMTTTIT
jgi:hypothetical protein